VTSLRRRILIGSILWTVGMIVVASAAFSVMMEISPLSRYSLIGHVHGTLQAPLTLALAALCLAAGGLQVRRALQRVDDMRTGLADLHTGRRRRLEGDYPAEVQPLVDDLNALLDHRDEAIRRAVGKAGDLAHGLKTPLAVLMREAESAGAAGHAELAAAVQQQVERMRRQVDHHLAHARAAASGSTPGTRSSVRASVEGLTRALQRIHADRGIAVNVESPEAHTVRVQREDLDEMLGNLLDNACKWARSRVVVGSTLLNDQLVITVDDDGPGLEPEMRAAVLQRGVRADEATPGSGFGLGIVRDLAEVYGGSIGLAESPLGGCRAVLRLP
jgi:signal transduction histidine kinase